ETVSGMGREEQERTGRQAARRGREDRPDGAIVGRRGCRLLYWRGVRSQWRRHHGLGAGERFVTQGNVQMASVLDLPLSEIARRLADGRLSARALTEEARSRHDPA